MDLEPKDFMIMSSSLERYFVPASTVRLLRTELILTWICSFGFEKENPYAYVLIPTLDVSTILLVIFEQPKNCVRDFEVKDTTPVVLSK